MLSGADLGCICSHTLGEHSAAGHCTVCPCPSFLEQGVHEVPAEPDPVNHPPHYAVHPSGVECIQITEHMNFNIGNAVKYLWRADEKGNAVEDLAKAEWYVHREIQRRAAQ